MNILADNEKQILFNNLSKVTPFTSREFDQLTQYLKKSTYKKGDIILEHSQVETKNSLVLSGIVHQYEILNEELFTIDLTLPGMYFSSVISYVDETKSTQIQEAITDVICLSLEKADAEKLMKTVPTFTYFYYKALENVHVLREKRTVILQYKRAQDRFDQFARTFPYADRFLKELPQKLVASYLNLTPETFSRVKREFFRCK